MPDSIVQIDRLTKLYGGIPALSEVSLEIRAGEVHALMGENGAGKSTLIKCLSGVLRPDAGTISVNGTPLPPGSVQVAEAAGISALHQESTSFPHLNAVDNIYMGREIRNRAGFLDLGAMNRGADELLKGVGESLDLRAPLDILSAAQRQMVGIARALARKSRLIIMDEPTASLSGRESEALFAAIRRLRSEGVAILYISHRIAEVLELADRVTVLRDGRLVTTLAMRDLTRDTLVELMVGRAISREARAERVSDSARERLTVTGLTRAGVFQDLTFSVHAGEIVGLAGLVGAGRSETAEAIMGISRADSGQILVDGTSPKPGSISAAVEAGLALVPEERQRQGLVLPFSVRANLIMAALPRLTKRGLRNTGGERNLSASLIQQLGIKTESDQAAVQNLSGGNQQKVLLGKWLALNPGVLMLDEPTRGVDVGARAEVYRIVRGLANSGAAILLISSDMAEILEMSDRILVMRQGRIAGELSGIDATEQQILSLALPIETGIAEVKL